MGRSWAEKKGKKEERFLAVMEMESGNGQIERKRTGQVKGKYSGEATLQVSEA